MSTGPKFEEIPEAEPPEVSAFLSPVPFDQIPNFEPGADPGADTSGPGIPFAQLQEAEPPPLTQPPNPYADEYRKKSLGENVEAAFDATIKPLREKVLRPVVEMGIAEVKRNIAGPDDPRHKLDETDLEGFYKPGASATEGIVRQGLSYLTGKDLVADAPKASAAIDTKFSGTTKIPFVDEPVKDATLVRHAADALFQLPAWAVAPNMMGARAAKAAAAVEAALPTAFKAAAPMTTKLLTFGAKLTGAGAAQVPEGIAGGILLADEGKDLGKSIQTNVLGNVVGGAGLTAAPIIARAAIRTSAKGMQVLADETAALVRPDLDIGGIVRNAPDTRPRPFELHNTKEGARQQSLIEKVGPDTKAHPKDKSFVPAFAVIMKNEEGQFVGRLAEYNTVGAPPRWKDVSIEDPAPRQKFGEMLKTFEIDYHVASKDIAEWSSRPATDMADIRFGKDTAAAELSADPNRDFTRPPTIRSVAATNPGRSLRGKRPLPQLDAPRIEPEPSYEIGFDDTRMKVSKVPTTEGTVNTRRPSVDPSEQLTQINNPIGGGAGPNHTKVTKAYNDLKAAEKSGDQNKIAVARNAYYLATNQAIVPVKVPHLIPPGPVPPPPPPGGLPAQAQTQLKRDAEILNGAALLKNQNPSLFKRMFGLLSHDAHSPFTPEEARHILNAHNGAMSLKNDTPHIIKRVWDAVGGDKAGKNRDDAIALAEVAKGNLSWQDFLRQSQPGGKDAALRFAEGVLREMEFLDKGIQALGGIGADLATLRDAGLIDQYLGSFYRLHTMPKGQWYRHMERYDRQALVDGINELAKANPKLSREQVEREVDQILSGEDPMEGFATSAMANPFGAMKAKNTALPQWFKRMIGEEVLGPERIGRTIANQRVIFYQLKNWAKVAQSPWFSPEKTASHIYPVPPNKGRYGFAAGGYVSHELKTMVEVAEMGTTSGWGAARMLVGKVGGFMKGNQVIRGGMAPWVNNVMRNMKGSVISGGAEWWRPLESSSSFAESIPLLFEHIKNPVGDSLVVEAKRSGALSAGFGRTEVSGVDHKVLDIISQKMGTNRSLNDVMFDVREAFEKLNWPIEKMNAAYDSIDSYFKFSNYLSLRKKFVRQGMPPEQAAAKAADRINQAFPNFDKPGKLTEWLRPYSGVAGAPYATANLEEQRINATTIHRVLDFVENPDPELVGNLGGFALMLQSAREGIRMWGRNNGISDEEREEAYQLQGYASKFYRPWIEFLPTRDKYGRLIPFNLGSWMPDVMLMAGDPGDHPAARLLTNLVTLPIQGGLLEPVVRRELDRFGIVRPPPEMQRKIKEYERGPSTSNVYNFLNETSLIPGAIDKTRRQIQNNAELGGKPGRFEEPRTNAETAAEVWGLPVMAPVTTSASKGAREEVPPGRSNPSRAGRTVDFIQGIKDVKKQLRQNAVQKEDALGRTITPEQRRENKRVLLKRLEALREQRPTRSTK